MVNFRFVFTDGGNNFLIPQDEIDTLKVDGVNISAIYHRNNTETLPEVFNSELDTIRSSGGFDFIAFVHGDVRFNPEEFIKRVVEAGTKYDLIGLAGTKRMDMDHSPLNWFTSSLKHPDSRYGDITMNKPQNGLLRCYYNQFTHPEVMDTEVACIDGLCIVFNKRMIDSKIMFMDGIKYNCYDTFISLEAILNYHFKVGVVVIPTKHLSIGKSILSGGFAEEERLMREYFNFGKKSENEKSS